MKKDTIKEFLRFEESVLSNPKTFFTMFEASISWRSELIWSEFVKWQNAGGKLKEFFFRENEIDKDIIQWRIGNEIFASKIDKRAPFTKEQYQKGIQAVYSFMEDRPQYYKFRNMEGIFNPLMLLLYEFLTPTQYENSELLNK